MQRLLHRVERVPLAGQDAEFHQLVERLGQGRGRIPLAVEIVSVGVEFPHRHAVHGQRPRLVHAKHGSGTEGLDGGGAAREDFAFRDPPGAEGEKDGEHYGKFFRHHCHGQGEPRQDAGDPVAPGQPVDDHDEDAEEQPRERKGADQAAGLLLERRPLLLHRLERLSDLAEFAPKPGGLHTTDPVALHHHAPRIDEGQVIPAGPSDRRYPVPRRLANRYGFPRQEGFVHREVRARQEQGVGRDAVSLGEDQQVVPDHLPSRDSPPLPVADDQGPGAGEVAQRLQGALRLPFLVQGDPHHDEDEAEEHQRFLHVSQDEVDRAARDEQEEHRLADDAEGDCENGAPLRRGEFVVPFLPQPPGGLILGEPF